VAGGELKFFYPNINLEKGIVTAALSFYSLIEGYYRMRLSDRKNVVGSLLLKVPLAPFEYFYDKYNQAHIELEQQLFSQTTVK